MSGPLLVVVVYLAVAFSWAGGWIAGKYGVSEVPPLELSATRFTIAALLLVAIARVTRVPLPMRGFGLVVLAAAFGVLGYNALVFVGLTMAPASDAALIVPTMAPVLTAVFATSIGERLTAGKVVGLLISSLGAAIVILAGALGESQVSRERLIGDLLVLGGAACWAGYATVGSVAMRDRSPLALVAQSAGVGAVMLFPLGFLERGYADVPTWSPGAWVATGYLVVFATIVGFVLFYWAVRRFGAGLGAMVTYLVPIATLVLAAILLGERPQPLQLVGGAVILIGLQIATRRAKTRELAEAAG